MINMELENDEVHDVSSIQNEKTEVSDKSKNPYEKKIHRKQKCSKKLRDESLQHNEHDYSRKIYLDLLLNKRGIFIKSSKPEDYAARFNNAYREPVPEVESLLAKKLKHKRRQRERNERKMLKPKTERRKRCKKCMEEEKNRLRKSAEEKDNSQNVKDNLDTLLARINIST